MAAAVYLLLAAVLISLRVSYPFDLEWLEGAALVQVQQVLEGRPLYQPPGIDYVPLIYAPGYFYAGAAASSLLGPGLLPLRAISILSSIAAAFILFRWGSRETGDRHAGVAAAGLFSAMFGWTAGWFDLARVDPLFLCLSLVAAYALRWNTSVRGAAVAAAWLGAACLVKQSALVVALPMLLAMSTRSWKHAAVFALTLTAVAGVPSVVLNVQSDGWYWYYVFDLPRQHPYAADAVVGFWRYDLVRPMPLALVAAAWLLLRPAGEFPRATYAGLLTGFIASAWLSRAHSLGFVNVVLPAYAMLSLVGAIAAYRVPAGRRRVPALVYALCLTQFALVAYRPGSFVPARADVEAGEALAREIAAASGPVWTPYHGLAQQWSTQASGANATAMADVLRGTDSRARQALETDVRQSLDGQRYQGLLLEDGATPLTSVLPIDVSRLTSRQVVSRRSRFWRPATLYMLR